MHSILQKYQNLLPAAGLALLVVVGSPAIASAQGSDTSTSGGTATTVTSDDKATTSVSGSTTVHTESTTESTTAPETTADSMSQSKASSGKRESAEAKAHKDEAHSAKTEAEREKVCDSRKNGLDTKFASITRNSQAYQTRIDSIYTKVLAYQASSGLKPAGFSDLTAAADAAKITATEAVAALAAAKPTVDCTSKTVASDVAGFKQKAATARADLKAYKQAVKAVVQSLRDARDAASTTTTSTTTEVKN